MENKENQKKFAWLLIGGFALYIFTGQVTTIKRNIRDMQYELQSQRQQIYLLEKEVDDLKTADQVVKDTAYYLREWTSGYPEVTYELKMTLDRNFEGPLTLYYRPVDTADWLTEEVSYKVGEGQLMQTFDSSFDYEMKIGYLEEGVERFEALPLLALYSKESDLWQSDVQTTKVKGNQLNYNVQIAQWRGATGTDLDGVICQLYYEGQLVDEFEVLERMQLEKQSLPKAVLESGDGQHWFVKREIVLGGIESIDPEKVNYQVAIHNNRGNVFERSYEMRLYE